MAYGETLPASSLVKRDAGPVAEIDVGGADRLSLLAARLSAISAESRDLSRQLASAQRENRRLLEALNQSQGENAALRASLDPAYRLVDELALLTGRISLLTSKVETQDRRFDEFESFVRHRESQNEDVDGQARSAELRGLLEVQNNRTCDIESVVRNHELVAEEQGRASRAIWSKVDHIIRLLENSRETEGRDDIARQLHEVLSSRSWRLTAPLRRLRALLSGRQ